MSKILDSKKRSVVGRRKLRARYVYILLSFIVFVAAPTFLVTHYLFNYAKDQYASTFAFSVRSAESKTPMDLLGGLSALGSISSSDTDILNEYLNSQSLVRELDKELNLGEIYSKYYEEDPWFSYEPEGTIEDLVHYWDTVSKVYYDKGGGFIEVRVTAFDPDTAKLITDTVLELCTYKINYLNQVTRADRLKYAKLELQNAEIRLKNARTSLTQYRSVNQLSDPRAEIEIVASVIGGLEKQLSDLLVELKLLDQTVAKDDPRIFELQQQIEIIKSRIEAEREKFSMDKSLNTSFSKIVGEFEGLIVDKEYAEQAYLAAQANYDSALSNADRQTRYLATYVDPTLADKSEYPRRFLISGLVLFFSFFIWSSITLVFYAIKDRR